LQYQDSLYLTAILTAKEDTIMDETSRNEMKALVKEAMDDKLRDFWVDREEHYQHHKFIAEFIQWLETCKSTITKTVVRGIVLTIIGLIILGFIFWGKTNIK